MLTRRAGSAVHNFNCDPCGRPGAGHDAQGSHDVHLRRLCTTRVTDARGNVSTITLTSSSTWRRWSIRWAISQATPGRATVSASPTPTATIRTWSSPTWTTAAGRGGVVYPNGDTFSFSYDAESRVETVANPQGFVTTLTWDGYDRVELLDPLGASRSFTTTRTARLPGETEEGTTSQEYDEQGLVKERIDPLGQRTSFTYNGYSQQSVENPEGTSSPPYDAAPTG